MDCLASASRTSTEDSLTPRSGGRAPGARPSLPLPQPDAQLRTDFLVARIGKVNSERAWRVLEGLPFASMWLAFGIYLLAFGGPLLPSLGGLFLGIIFLLAAVFASDGYVRFNARTIEVRLAPPMPRRKAYLSDISRVRENRDTLPVWLRRMPMTAAVEFRPRSPGRRAKIWFLPLSPQDAPTFVRDLRAELEQLEDRP